jgi:hypothetical protein
MEEYLRMDYFFSYWIVIWFIIYYFIIKTNIINTKTKTTIRNNFNPKFALYIALFENLCIFIYLLFHKPTLSLITKYILMMVVLKVIPLYLLQEEAIILPKDLLPVSVLFVFYNIYLTFIQTSLYSIYKSSAHYLIKGSNKTPFFTLLSQLGSRFSSKSS